MDHERIIRGLIESLESTRSIAEDAHHTGAFKGGIRRAVALYNGALSYMQSAELVDERFFTPLSDDAVFDDVGVACGQLAAYIRGYLGISNTRGKGPMNIDINELIDGIVNPDRAKENKSDQ